MLQRRSFLKALPIGLLAGAFALMAVDDASADPSSKIRKRVRRSGKRKGKKKKKK